MKNPQNRLDVIRGAIERVGGTLEGGWLSFGDHDVVLISKLPETVNAAAFSIAVTAGGALKSSKTTPLITFDEGLKAMQQAAKADYLPPS